MNDVLALAEKMFVAATAEVIAPGTRSAENVAIACFESAEQFIKTRDSKVRATDDHAGQIRA